MFSSRTLVICTLFVIISWASFAGIPVEDSDIDTYIQSLVSKIRTETREARQVVKESSGQSRTAVLFTLESGQYYVQHLAVLSKTSSQVEIIMRGEVGGRGRAQAKIKSFAHGTLVLEKKLFGPGDAECCPTIAGEEVFNLDGPLPSEPEPTAVSISKDMERRCAAAAKDLTLTLAHKIWKQRMPKPPFKSKESKLQTARLIAGQSTSPIADYSIVLASKDEYECDFIAQYEVDEKQKSCRFLNLEFRMCAH